MTIGINARFFSSKDKGLGRYTENLIKELEKIDSQNQYFVFLRKERWNDYNSKNLNFKKCLFNDLNKHKIDLMHFTYFRDAFFYKGRFVVTIHDLITSHVSFLKKIAFKTILKNVFKKAEKIIAVSDYTKKDILRNHRVNPDKIKVIYEGIAPARNARRSFGEHGKKYILYVGNDYPHKNLERLKSAFGKINLDYELILVTGFINEKDLNRVYKNASLYVQPSLVEGFGFPPLEAMARGVPVVSSNAACLPEVLEDAAIYFDPLNVDDIADKIKKTLLDDRVKKELIRRGFEKVKKYNWKKTAKETLEIYRKVFIH